MEKLRPIGAMLVTVLSAVLVIWWLIKVGDHIGTKPELDPKGNVVLDEWQRAKDILLVLLPLFSATLAFWVGSQGTTDAKKDAADARQQLTAVVDSSQGILKKARQEHPDAFSN